MRLVILPEPKDVANFAAEQFCKQISTNPRSVLGLATGSTPVLLYHKLAGLVEKGAISFSQATSFNLDEYVGLREDHPQSYRSFMEENLFKRSDFKPENTHLPRGGLADVTLECLEYERKITAAGGIDLQLLGLGENGHIGFNEPLSSLSSRTRLKTLNRMTMAANSRFFDSNENQPELAITMGIGTVMEARAILLLATGEKKSTAAKAFIEGPVSAACPASILQFHNKVLIVLDEAAAARLSLKDYAQKAEILQQGYENRAV